MSDTPILQAEAVAFTYPGGTRALDGVNLAARQGQLLCLLGPNGSGKTTLLRCLLGALGPQEGRVVLDGRDIGAYSARQRARKLAYVPQSSEPSLAFSAWQIVLTGRYAHTGVLGLAGQADREVARAAMEMTESYQLAERTLDELSGGEAQRVMIARALAQQPSVCLLDEPTSHLDIRNQLRIYRMMQRLAHDWRMAVICVSHDVNLAARFADRLMLLRDGRTVIEGAPPEVVTRDALAEAYDVDVELIERPDGGKIVWAKSER